MTKHLYVHCSAWENEGTISRLVQNSLSPVFIAARTVAIAQSGYPNRTTSHISFLRIVDLSTEFDFFSRFWSGCVIRSNCERRTLDAD